jgi:7-cyano-7-deazaguanine synthase in queuosine biosynthesis
MNANTGNLITDNEKLTTNMLTGISVLFSGGPDSTLAALIALQRAKKVHLLTFHHKKMGKVGKHIAVVNEMKRLFGEDRVINYSGDTNDLFNRFYLNNFSKKFLKYRTFYVPWICGACKLAMHSSAIKYNLENGINTLYDGANEESNPYFVDQTESYINVMKMFFKTEYGMDYDCPVYNIKDTDKECGKYGLKTTENTKQEHFVFSTQHTCLNGVLVHLHSRFYYKILRGKKRTEKLGEIFLSESLKENISLFPKKFCDKFGARNK